MRGHRLTGFCNFPPKVDGFFPALSQALAAVVLAFLLVFGASGAAAERLVCRFPEDNATDGWVSPVMIFDVRADGRVVVADSIVLDFNDGPMVTRVRTNTARRLTVTWDIETRDRWGNRSNMRFTAFISRVSMVAHILSQPRGFRAFPQIRGRCQPRS